MARNRREDTPFGVRGTRTVMHNKHKGLVATKPPYPKWLAVAVNLLLVLLVLGLLFALFCFFMPELRSAVYATEGEITYTLVISDAGGRFPTLTEAQTPLYDAKTGAYLGDVVACERKAAESSATPTEAVILTVRLFATGSAAQGYYGEGVRIAATENYTVTVQDFTANATCTAVKEGPYEP